MNLMIGYVAWVFHKGPWKMYGASRIKLGLLGVVNVQTATMCGLGLGTLLQVLPIPAMLWYLCHVEKGHFTFWEQALWVSAFVPIALNTHWYSGMVKTAIAALSGGEDGKSSKEHSN